MNLEDVGANGFTFPICINEETNPRKPRDFSAVIQVANSSIRIQIQTSFFLYYFFLMCLIIRAMHTHV